MSNLVARWTAHVQGQGEKNTDLPIAVTFKIKAAKLYCNFTKNHNK